MPVSVNVTVQAKRGGDASQVLCITIQYRFINRTRLVSLHFPTPALVSIAGKRDVPINEYTILPKTIPQHKVVDSDLVSDVYRFNYSTGPGVVGATSEIRVAFESDGKITDVYVTPTNLVAEFVGNPSYLMDMVDWDSATSVILADANLEEVANLMLELFQQRGGGGSCLPQFEVLLEKTADPSKRLDLLKRISTVDGSISRAWLLLGRQHQAMGQIGDAIDALEKATKLSSVDEEVLMQLAQLYETAGRADELITLLVYIIEKSPGRVDALARLAPALLRKGDGDRLVSTADGLMKKKAYRVAMVGYWHATRAFPNNFAGWLGLGDACRDNQLIDDAIVAYRSALAVQPSSGKALLRLGRMFEAKGDLGGVVDLYDPLVKTGSVGTSILVHLGHVLMKLQQYGRATEVFSAVFNSDHKNLEAIACLGTILYKRGYKKELEAFWGTYIPPRNVLSENSNTGIPLVDSAVNMIGQPPVDYNKLATALQENLEYDTCIHFMECIIKRNHDDWRALGHLAFCHYMRKNHRAAISAAIASLGKVPIQTRTLTPVLLGVLQASLGDLSTAVRTLGQHPDSFFAKNGLRGAYMQWGNSALALQITEEIIMGEGTPASFFVYLLSSPMSASTRQRVMSAVQKRMAKTPRYFHGRLFLGWLQASLGKFDDAAQSFNKILADYPVSVPAILALETVQRIGSFKKIAGDVAGLLYKPGADDYNLHSVFQLMLEDTNGAIESMKRSLAIAPTRKEVLHRLAYTYHNLEDNESAISVCKDAVNVDDRDPAFWEAMGTFCFNMRDMEAAVEAFTEASARDPNNPRPQFYVGASWLSKSETAKAIQAFSAATRIDPKYYPALVFLEKSLHRSGDSSGASLVAARISKVLPPTQEYFEVAYCASFLRDLTTSSRHYSLALKQNPDSYVYQNNLALIIESQGDFPLAIEMFEKAIELDPRSFHAWHNLSRVKEGAGDVAGAFKVLKDYIQRFSPTETGWVSIGELYLREGMFLEAKVSFKNAVDARPDLYRGWNYSAIAQHLAKEGGDRVQASIKRSIEIMPGNALAMALDRLLGSDGNGQGDSVDMSKLAEPVRMKDWGDLCWGLMALGSSHAASAVDACERFTSRFPYLGKAWVALGSALEDNWDLEGAERALKRAIEIDPYDYSCMAILGRVLSRADKVREALELLTHLTATYPAYVHGWVALARAGLASDPPNMEFASIAMEKASRLRADDIGLLHVRAIQALKMRQIDGCLDIIEKIVVRDVRRRGEIVNDPHLAELRENPRFKALVGGQVPLR